MRCSRKSATAEYAQERGGKSKHYGFIDGKKAKAAPVF
jgi:hypothetical protein